MAEAKPAMRWTPRIESLTLEVKECPTHTASKSAGKGRGAKGHFQSGTNSPPHFSDPSFYSVHPAERHPKGPWVDTGAASGL